MKMRLIFIVTLTLLSVGCAQTIMEKSEPVATGSAPVEASGGTDWSLPIEPNGNVVEVFYGSNRNVVSRSETSVEFGSKRSSKVSYGRCLITIPPDHKTGKIERPWLSWFAPDPKNHMVLEVNRSYSNFREMSNEIRRKPGKKIFVFIHGYNVKFEDAALRTGQMARDLRFDGTPIFFSWPAKGKLLGYPSDESDIAWSAPYIKNFLTDLIKTLPGTDLYIIAHSMGTRGSSEAVKEIIRTDKVAAGRIKELILAAPDIDQDIFKEQIMPFLSEAKLPTTVYTSDNDRALKVSAYLHGYLRVGSGFSGEKNLEVVDASEGDTDWLGHSYFAENVPVLNDIFSIVTYQHRAEKRFMLKRVKNPQGDYWKLQPSP